ncbi:MAG: hypothetical protein KGZ65_06070, partial [Sphingomonadales bacterium]|nr:hypothetical protein [Sphingomonadales bacterium]
GERAGVASLANASKKTAQSYSQNGLAPAKSFLFLSQLQKQLRVVMGVHGAIFTAFGGGVGCA